VRRAQPNICRRQDFVITPGGDLAVRHLPIESARMLAALSFAAGPGQVLDQRSTRIADLAGIFRATVFVAEQTDRTWRVAAEAVVDRAIPCAADISVIAKRPARSAPDVWIGAGSAARSAAGGWFAPWTVVALHIGRRRRAALFIAGDWRLSSPPLLALALRMAAAVRGDRPSYAWLGRITHQLTQRLARTDGMKAVCDAIVESAALAVDARFASVAVATRGDRRLTIKSTYGYPMLLVEHLRIDPGEGILGLVYQSGKPLRITERAQFPAGPARRARFKTDSFVAVPIRTGDDVLGVLAVADRADGQPFSPWDAKVLRTLAAPAALALSRERAEARADVYAHAAAVDPVSGLFNRRYFHIRIDEEVERSRRHEIPVALLMLDLDDFKSINDVYGHLAGDAILKETAEILRRSVRVFDVCTRFGGEEFAIVMPGSDLESAAAVAERIRDRIESYRPTDPSLANLRVTISIGLAVWSGGVTSQELISRADQALYVAKREGKNRVRFFDGA
jgi:diguanylate cyclase (GGDEF)-like protein